MALHPEFPRSPFAVLEPQKRWFPADEALRERGADSLIPPLVGNLRRHVKDFRAGGYVGASETSKSLLRWWFEEEHLLPQQGEMTRFSYYFAQREALETIIYLYDVVGAKDKFDLMRFDGNGSITAKMFDETWRRYVVKMATGSGKTKVMSLVLAWSFFHKLYEAESDLSRNFLVIAPNIIVFDRIRKDFQGLRIFFEDPVIPSNGYDGRDWQHDFNLTLHLQDEVRVVEPTGNIFLTNIHRVYMGQEVMPSPQDDDLRDFLFGRRPTGKTTDSKVDLGMIVRDLDELLVINDEAHHIHDNKLAWFKSIEDIHNRLLQKDSHLSLQIDVTATPKHNNGAIFVQTISDYPLVEAIWQGVVKRPVLPDAPSRAKLQERQSVRVAERWADYLQLGVVEWRKAYDEHIKLGKKAILFVMTEDTKECDEIAAYLETLDPLLQNSVLTIHTKNNGEISEAASGKKKEELEALRKQANEIDDPSSPYKVIVSVLMLKEGWDVRNVTTIVGLRPYSAKSNILPEQTLGRGLRKMYSLETDEYVSVIGTNAFIEFIESIKADGVELENKPMGTGTQAKAPLVIEVDNENTRKDLDALDMEIPILTPRMVREYKNLADLDVSTFPFQTVTYQQFTEEEQREIVFKDITTDKITHTTLLGSATNGDINGVVSYFARLVMRELRLVSGFDILYGKIKAFLQNNLFGQTIDLNTTNTLRNLSEVVATRTTLETFKKAINALTVQDRGDTEIKETIKLRQTRPFVVSSHETYLPTKKSIFNRVVGDSHFELEFASFLEDCPDVLAYAKNYLAVQFKLDYVRRDGNIAHYYPDFFVKLAKQRIVIVETKGLEDLEVPRKMERLKTWCEDVNRAQSQIHFDYVFVDMESFEKYRPTTFKTLLQGFQEYK